MQEETPVYVAMARDVDRFGNIEAEMDVNANNETHAICMGM